MDLQPRATEQDAKTLEAQTPLHATDAARERAAGQPLPVVPDLPAPAAGPGVGAPARQDRESGARGAAARWAARVAGTVAVVLVLAWLVRWALEGPPEAAWSSASQGAPLEPARPAPEGVREPVGGSRSATLPVAPPADAQATSVPAQGPVSALPAPAARPEGVPVSPSKRAPSGTGVAPEDGAPAVAGTGDATRNVGGRPQPQSVDATPPMSSPTSSARGSVAGAPVADTQDRTADAPAAPPRAGGAAPSAAPLPPLRLDELPVSVRRAIPALRIDGIVQSPSPANRLLLVNGQVLRERETLIPGLQLEGIGPDSAIFTWRGQRFQLPYTDTAPRSP